jgi:hypothetical protein
MRAIPYILYIYLITFHETILVEGISIFGISIDPYVLLVALVGLYKTDLEAFWFAFAVGIVAGSVRLDLMPYQVLVLTAIGVAVNELSVRINLDSVASRIIILAGAVIVHKSIMTLLISADQFPYMLVRYIVPGAAYTMLAGFLFFMIKDGRVTWQRIKTLF